MNRDVSTRDLCPAKYVLARVRGVDGYRAREDGLLFPNNVLFISQVGPALAWGMMDSDDPIFSCEHVADVLAPVAIHDAALSNASSARVLRTEGTAFLRSVVDGIPTGRTQLVEKR